MPGTMELLALRLRETARLRKWFGQAHALDRACKEFEDEMFSKPIAAPAATLASLLSQ